MRRVGEVIQALLPVGHEAHRRGNRVKAFIAEDGEGEKGEKIVMGGQYADDAISCLVSRY